MLLFFRSLGMSVKKLCVAILLLFGATGLLVYLEFIPLEQVQAFLGIEGKEKTLPVDVQVLQLIEAGELKAGVPMLLQIDDELAWEVLGNLSDEKRSEVMAYLLVLARDHFSKSQMKDSEHLVEWILEHSGDESSELLVLKAELLLFRGREEDCAGTLYEITGEVHSIDQVNTDTWSKRLKDFFAAAVLKGEIVKRKPVTTLGAREYTYDEFQAAAEPSVGSSPPSTTTTSFQPEKSDASTGSQSRVRGLRYRFNDHVYSIDQLQWFTKHVHRGMETSVITKAVGPPSRIIESQLPTTGLFKTLDQTQRWDYVTKEARKGVALTVFDGKVRSFLAYEVKAR